MDYPKKVPNVGLVNGKFVDENTATGQVGSLIPATWGSSVTDELLNVIMGGGYVPDENNNGQVLSAIKELIKDKIPDAMPKDGGPYYPQFKGVRLTGEVGGYNVGGGYMGWGANGSGTMQFVCHPGAGAGGFFFGHADSAGLVKNGMAYTAAGRLEVAMELYVPAIASNTVVPTHGVGYAGAFIANCAYVVASITAAVAVLNNTISSAIAGVNNSISGRISGDSCDVAGFASQDSAKPYMHERVTDKFVLLQTADGALGNKQTWQNVTSSRAFSTTYTNSTGRPIMIAIGGLLGAGIYDYVTASINGGAAFPFCAGASTAGQTRAGGTLIVPTGATYNLVSSIPMTSWWELR